MCEALRELMNDEIEEEKRIAVEEATKEIKQVAEEAEKAAEEAEKAAEIKVAKAEREVKKTAKETVLTNIRSLTRTSRNQNAQEIASKRLIKSAVQRNHICRGTAECIGGTQK